MAPALRRGSFYVLFWAILARHPWHNITMDKDILVTELRWEYNLSRRNAEKLYSGYADAGKLADLVHIVTYKDRKPDYRLGGVKR